MLLWLGVLGRKRCRSGRRRRGVDAAARSCARLHHPNSVTGCTTEISRRCSSVDWKRRREGREAYSDVASHLRKNCVCLPPICTSAVPSRQVPPITGVWHRPGFTKRRTLKASSAAGRISHQFYPIFENSSATGWD